MDQNSRNPNLGLNPLSKPIRKSPPPPAAAAPPPQPHVYKISKNDFRSIVQQLTGTPTRDPANPNPLPPPPPRPKHPSMRMQRIRPPPLPSLTRPPIAPPPPVYADSPVTAYMRYLETSLQLTPATSTANYVQPYPSPLPPSPTGFLNLLSPRSPYPLLSPGLHHPPPLSPGFSFTSQPGLLSPGLRYPMSPSGYFPLLSPRWSDL